MKALTKARELGVDIVPVWNKSHREHSIIHTEPASVRQEADKAVETMGWEGQYCVDADHIGIKSVDMFLESSDFFTLDVADYIGVDADSDDMAAFIQRHSDLIGMLSIPGIEEPFSIKSSLVLDICKKYLGAVKEAGRIYRHIEEFEGEGNFITEVSMDETAAPQTPIEMLFILIAIADEGVPAQTFAPRFSGRFNKGVDYVGDVSQFAREFEDDLAVIRFAVEKYPLPANLKLSVHSGSDKFSIYAPIRNAIRKYDTGLHLKTAGTTWLEELVWSGRG